MSSRQPNIVIVHGHDLGRTMGPYGRGADTPNVDAFARSAVTFDRAFAPAPQCSPSRASLMTGKYPNGSGMMGLAHLDWSLNDPRGALPHLLQGLGYQTLLVGEQHEATSGELLGYQRCLGTKWPQVASRVAPEFAQALDELDLQRPFFASVGFFEAHRPFDQAGYTDPSPELVEVPPYLPDTPEVRADLAAFHGRVRGFDVGVGAVLAALEARGLADETIVVVTTDHGVAFPRAKGTLYDAGLETGLLVRWPGITEPGTRCDALVANIDLFATLLHAAGGALPEAVDGIDLRPLLEGRVPAVRDHFFAQLHWHDAYVPMRAIRTDTHKLIVDFSDRDELYLPKDVEESASGRALRAASPQPTTTARFALHDLAADPLERRNVWDDRDASALGRELRHRLEQWMLESRDPLVSEWTR